ncbi:unnamed protein product [Caenorhabditis brenneri]
MSFIHDNEEEDVTSTLPIDGYNVEKYISRGSFGSIYKVRPIHAPTTVQAVKEILWRSENAIDQDTEQKFAEREYEIQQRLSQLDNNGFFLQTYEFRSLDGGFLIFMDFEEGEDLFNKINFAISPAMAKNYFKQLIQALEVVHEHGVIHRDVKTKNILITRADTVKLIDFGLATPYKPDRYLPNYYGTQYCAPPETRSSQLPIKGPPTDVWAAGIVLLSLSTGEHTFWKEAKEDQPAYLQWKEKRYSENEVFRKLYHLPANLVDLLEKILCHDPLQRLTLDDILAHEYLSSS